MAACTCCDEHDAHPLCGDLCEECARPGCCADCNNELDSWTTDAWAPGDKGPWLCEACQTKTDQADALESLYQRAIADAEQRGWEIDSKQTAQTRTRYLTLSQGDDSFRLRVAGHGTAYCSEDISLVAGHGSGDDHHYDTYLQRLNIVPLTKIASMLSKLRAARLGFSSAS